MILWIPTINGFFAGETPDIWEDTINNKLHGFPSESACEEWIDNHEDCFSLDELGGGIYPRGVEVDILYVFLEEE